MDLLIEYLKAFPLEVEGARWERVRAQCWGVIVSARVRMMEGVGQIFATLVRTYYLNDP